MCQQATTLAASAPITTHGFVPWEVDRLAIPLPGSLWLDEDATPDLDEARDVLTTIVALFYVAFRQSWGKFDMTRCDLHPSCSRFALEAVRHTPLWLAVPLTFGRIMRNHNASDLPRDVHGHKRDPVTHHTFTLPTHHAGREPTYDTSIKWFQHARAIKEECPR